MGRGAKRGSVGAGSVQPGSRQNDPPLPELCGPHRAKPNMNRPAQAVAHRRRPRGRHARTRTDTGVPRGTARARKSRALHFPAAGHRAQPLERGGAPVGAGCAVRSTRAAGTAQRRALAKRGCTNARARGAAQRAAGHVAGRARRSPKGRGRAACQGAGSGAGGGVSGGASQCALGRRVCVGAWRGLRHAR